MIRYILAAMMLSVLLPVFASGENRDEEWVRPVVCCENRLGCQVLQMVMMGSFDSLSPDDKLSIRVFSAAYPKLKSVTEEDIRHFSQEFGVEEPLLISRYHDALGSCLWADILMDDAQDVQEQEARELLLLFLDPALQESAAKEIQLIRAAADETFYKNLAERADLTPAFVRDLIQGESVIMEREAR